jgi:hypothetical protein
VYGYAKEVDDEAWRAWRMRARRASGAAVIIASGAESADAGVGAGTRSNVAAAARARRGKRARRRMLLGDEETHSQPIYLSLATPHSVG